MKDKRTHRDYVSVIGGTTATARNFREKRWNQYYARAYRRVVDKMLSKPCKGVVLDVGTSHGNWFPFLKKKGFDIILGIELDDERADKARACGYDEVHTCDAANVPFENASIDYAISNDVFVHILQLKDKSAVLREIERLLKPGGIFILNHTISKAHGFKDYHISGYCSFLSLDEFIRLIKDNTAFRIVDIEPTYFNWRNTRPNLLVIGCRKLIVLPGAVSILSFFDRVYAKRLSIEQSDTIYLKLEK